MLKDIFKPILSAFTTIGKKCSYINTLFIIFLLSNTTSTFAQNNFTGLTFTVQPSNMCLQKNESRTLTCFAKGGISTIYYFWYETDKEGFTRIPISDDWSLSPDLVIEPFSEIGIRFFICEATDDRRKNIYSDIVSVAYTGLPIVYISTGDTPTSAITKDAYVQADFKIVMPDGTQTSYELKKKGIKGRGNSSWTHSSGKKPYNLNFDNKVSFFGLSKSKKWCLINNYSDRSLLRNKYASVLGQELFDSEWNPTHTSIDLILNNEYLGNYTLCEKISLEDGRVDYQDISDCTEEKIEKGKYTDQNGDGIVDLYDGGFILEFDFRRDGDYWFNTRRKLPVVLKDPDEIDSLTQKHIKQVVQNAEDVLYSENFSDEDEGWRKYINESSVIDWFIVNELAKDVDCGTDGIITSVYVNYSPIDGKLHFGPNWDYDISFGRSNYTHCIQSSAGTNPKNWSIKYIEWISRLFDDPLFVTNLKSRWNENKSQLSETFRNNGLVQSLADEIAVSAEANFVKWKILGVSIWPVDAEGYQDRKTYQSEIDYLRNWLIERYVWLDAAINKSFTISYDLNGGTLSKSNPNVFISKSTKSFALNNPTKDGYIFVGWIGTGLNGPTEKVTIYDDNLGDKAFTAVWQEQKDIALCGFAVDDEAIYSGDTVFPKISITDGELQLIQSIDYTITPTDDCINLGEHSVTITGIGSYTGSVSKSFTILPNVLINPIITLSDSIVIYNGTAIKPTITIKDGKTVIPESEYTLSFANNTNVGTATVTITNNDGGNYVVCDTSATFTIVQMQIDTALIELSESSFVYDGSAKTPSITINYGETIIPESEYIVTFTNNTDAGTATATITDIEGGNYAVEKFQAEFIIIPKTIDNLTIVLSENEFIYDGQEKTPSIMVKDGETLIPESEYLVSYTNNISVGTAKVIITDNEGGNYVVTKTETEFIINPDESQNPTSDISETRNNARVWAYEGSIYIESSFCTEYRIVDINGRIITVSTANSPREEIQIAKTGIYLVQICNKSYMVFVK
ncbi:MAG: CotH kinase family protein [Salinivirgaceae bacterium]|nr:CotH kinase family protein [Salinivirgaceae bacterium]